MARWASPCITASAKAAPLPPISARMPSPAPVQAALDIAPTPLKILRRPGGERSAGVRGAGSRSVPPTELDAERGIELAARAEQASLAADKRITTNTEGGSFNSHYGIKVFGNSHGMLQSYCSSRHSLSSCVIAEQDGDMERDYA